MKTLVLLLLLPAFINAQIPMAQLSALQKPSSTVVNSQSKASAFVASIKDSIIKTYPARFVVYQDTSVDKYLQVKYVINTTQSKLKVNNDGSITAIELLARQENANTVYTLQGNKTSLQKLKDESVFFKKFNLKQLDPLVWELTP